MKNKKSFLVIVLSCLFLSINIFSSAQTTSLTYKVKGKSNYITNVSFSDANGNIGELTPETYFSYTSLYFLLTPNAEAAKDFFREDDVNEILSGMRLMQGEKVKIAQNVAPKIILNEDGKIDRVLLSYPKDEIKIYLNVYFGVEEFFSDILKIEEKYFKSYADQKNNYELGLVQIEKKDFTSAFSSFMTVVEAGNNAVEIQYLSFYNELTIKLIPNSIEFFLNSELIKFDSLNKLFQTEKSFASLNNFDAFTLEATEHIKLFDPFFAVKDIDVSRTKNQADRFLSKVKDKNQENNASFGKEKMLFFKEGNYNDFKFNLYLNLISKLLIYKESLSLVDKIEPIEISNLDYFPDSKAELIGNWEEDLSVYISLINKSIKQYNWVFNEEIMTHLQELVPMQKQPYFEIISAFNSLNTNTELFKNNLKAAQTKSSDEDILDYIEYWILSYRLTNGNVNADLMEQLNEGITLIQTEKYTQADDIFNMLLRMANDNALVWYYSGRIKYGLGETFSAEHFFKKALEIYPEYLAPRKFILNIFEKNEDYDQYLENANQAVKTSDTWFFRYKRAMAYSQLNMHKEAIEEITNDCILKNPWDLNQYFLLGDSYLALNEFDKATEAYRKTLEINPFSSDTKIFDERMKLVEEKKAGSKTSSNK